MKRGIATSLVALLLALGAVAAPAVARPDHNGGASTSDPDDNGRGPDRSNGGADKPGGAGGTDQDKDGNNGCGNDADREDDNEGWCGNKPKDDGGGDPTDPTDPTIT